jgi:hypothetical protein
MSTYLRRNAAAAYVREKHGVPCSPKTLAKQASVGGGPRYSLYGRIPLYAPADLDAYVQSKISKPVRSTSEYSGFGPNRNVSQPRQVVDAYAQSKIGQPLGSTSEHWRFGPDGTGRNVSQPRQVKCSPSGRGTCRE